MVPDKLKAVLEILTPLMYSLMSVFADFVWVRAKTVWPTVAVYSSVTSLTRLKSVPLMATVMAELPFPFTNPLRVLTPVPPFETGKIPVTPVDKGKPVKFVATPDAGVPRVGLVNTGEVKVLFVNVSIPVKLTFRFNAV